MGQCQFLNFYSTRWWLEWWSRFICFIYFLILRFKFFIIFERIGIPDWKTSSFGILSSCCSECMRFCNRFVIFESKIFGFWFVRDFAEFFRVFVKNQPKKFRADTPEFIPSDTLEWIPWATKWRNTDRRPPDLKTTKLRRRDPSDFRQTSKIQRLNHFLFTLTGSFFINDFKFINLSKTL